jgi:DNA repair protein RadD
MRQGNKSVLLRANTGAGKTIISSTMIAGSKSKDKRCMMVVPRKELLKQTADTFNKLDIPFTFIASGLPTNPFAQTFLAIVPTLVNRLDNAPDVDILIIDETHYDFGRVDKIVKHYKAKGTYIVGLSATPTREDGIGLDCLYDAMVEGESTRWLIDNKRLSDYRLFAASHLDVTGIRKVAGDFNKSDLEKRMLEDKVIMGDAIKHYKEHAMGKLTVGFTTSRIHSMKVSAEFNEAGIPSAYIDGSMKDDERTRIIKAFARREILHLVNCDLLTFGFDLASAAQMDVTIEVMIDFAATQSLARQLQKWGRVLRYKDEPAIIFDCVGNFLRHGHPCSDREWSLEGIKKGVGEGKEKTIPVRECKKCHFTHPPAPKCPECGYVYVVEEVKLEHDKTVELVEIQIGEQVAQIPKDREKQFNYLTKAVGLAPNLALGVIRKQAK